MSAGLGELVEGPASNVEVWALDRVVPYARNARQHSDEQVLQIAASLREWGWTVPLLVDPDGTLIAGHGRVAAATRLGLTHAPVIVARGWSPAQIQAYRIADNQLSLLSSWHPDFLTLELQELREGGFGIQLLGFPSTELDALLRGWESDVDLTEKHGENLDGLAATLKVVVDEGDKERTRLAIESALNAEGVRFEIR